MLCHGKDRNFSEFLITTNEDCSFFDGYHVAFGRCIEGYDVIEKIENLYYTNRAPVETVSIQDCGILSSSTEEKTSS